MKKNFNKIDNALIKVTKSEYVEKTINFIDTFDTKLANNIIKEIESITPLLETEKKEEFRDNIKKLIKEKKNNRYQIEVFLGTK